MEPIHAAARAARPPETPLPRQCLEKWSSAGFLRDVIEKGGLEKNNVTLTKVELSYGTPELMHFAKMLWSFIGGTSAVGWLEEDERMWDEAVDVIQKELKKAEGFRELGKVTAQLRFIANVAVATK